MSKIDHRSRSMVGSLSGSCMSVDKELMDTGLSKELELLFNRLLLLFLGLLLIHLALYLNLKALLFKSLLLIGLLILIY